MHAPSNAFGGILVFCHGKTETSYYFWVSFSLGDPPKKPVFLLVPP